VPLLVAVGEKSFFAPLLTRFVEGYRAKGPWTAIPLTHSAMTDTDPPMRVHRNLHAKNFCICHTSCHTKLDSL
jgi:hypothetical protein